MKNQLKKNGYLHYTTKKKKKWLKFSNDKNKIKIRIIKLII